MTPREQLYETIQAQAGVEYENSESVPEGAVLTAFLVVAEWEDPGGDRWISKFSGDHGRDLPPWRQRGMAAEIVHAYWDASP